MAKKHYTVASEEGARHCSVEVGEDVHLDLEPDQELALVAAGWIEPASTTKKKED